MDVYESKFSMLSEFHLNELRDPARSCQSVLIFHKEINGEVFKLPRHGRLDFLSPNAFSIYSLLLGPVIIFRLLRCYSITLLVSLCGFHC